MLTIHKLGGFRRVVYLHDVIVVGGGPAGNIAALRLAKLGHDVAVLDWRRDLGDKLCTGIIGKECFVRFTPDDRDVLSEARSATIVAPSGKTHQVAKDEAQAYIVDRISFVASIAGKAAHAGAVYRLGERVVSVGRSPHGVEVSTKGDSGTRQYQAKVALVASGFGSLLPGMVGLANGAVNDHLSAVQAVVETDCLSEPQVYLGQAVAPGSFGWLVPINGSAALAGVVTRQRHTGHLDGFMDTLEKDGIVRSVIQKPRRWGIPVKPLPRTYADRVLVAGDAAGLAKPTTGGGIYYALLSGEIAAETLDGALIDDDVSERRLKAYESAWKSVLGNEIRIGYYARLIYEALGDPQIERLLDELLETGIQRDLLNSEDFSFDWHGRIVLKAINHTVLGALLRSFGPAVGSVLAGLVRARAT